jgi:FkbM family methyltransferase
MAQLSSGNGHVYAFEPLKIEYQILSGYSKKYPNISCHNIAILDRAGYVEIKIPFLLGILPESYLAYVAEFPDNRKGLLFQVEAQTIDAFCSKFDRLDFIKLDMEGSEFRALTGGLETITRLRPVLQIEENRIAEEKSRLLTFAKSHNYSVFYLDNFSKLIELDQDSLIYERNFYLIPQEKL